MTNSNLSRDSMILLSLCVFGVGELVFTDLRLDWKDKGINVKTGGRPWPYTEYIYIRMRERESERETKTEINWETVGTHSSRAKGQPSHPLSHVTSVIRSLLTRARNNVPKLKVKYWRIKKRSLQDRSRWLLSDSSPCWFVKVILLVFLDIHTRTIHQHLNCMCQEASPTHQHTVLQHTNTNTKTHCAEQTEFGSQSTADLSDPVYTGCVVY